MPSVVTDIISRPVPDGSQPRWKSLSIGAGAGPPMTSPTSPSCPFMLASAALGKLVHARPPVSTFSHHTSPTLARHANTPNARTIRRMPAPPAVAIAPATVDCTSPPRPRGPEHAP